MVVASIVLQFTIDKVRCGPHTALYCMPCNVLELRFVQENKNHALSEYYLLVCCCCCCCFIVLAHSYQV